ncbi:MAG TPA: hypothetical protein VMY78_04760 [Solirubrobacteraceae bacterium]|nr:hypothetical protein [Solirubrobacteraceae bacterium]
MSRAAWIAVVAVPALLVPAAPAAAVGACETVERAAARHDPSRLRRAPLVVGDSTMLLAAPYLGRLGLEADARGCRQVEAGIDLLRSRRRARALPAVAVLALGANGAISARAIGRALRVMGPFRVLGLVTPSRVGSGSTGAMRRAARRYPDRVMLIDWERFGRRRGGGIFAGDGLHVSDRGARIFAAFVRRRLEPFFGPPRALRIPATDAGARPCGVVRSRGRALDVLVVRGGTRLLCLRARRLARAPAYAGIRGWRYYDYRRSGRRPWSDVYVRADRGIVVVTRAARPAPPTPAAGSPPARAV